MSVCRIARYPPAADSATVVTVDTTADPEQAPDRLADREGRVPTAPSPDPHRSLPWPGLALAVGVAAVAVLLQHAVAGLSPLLLAVLAGAVLSNTRAVPASLGPGLQVASRRLLRAGIVLLGLQLSLSDIAALGGGTIAVVVAVVVLGITGTLALGRWLRVPPALRLLIATGFSICGAAAVAAMEDTADADEEEVATAVGMVVLFGTVMIAVVPAVTGLWGLGPQTAGLVAGASIHEVAQVVAAAGVIGSGALKVAVVTKLGRVLMLAPVILVVGSLRRRGTARDAATRPPLLPLFVVGFLAAVVLRSTVHLDPALLTGAATLQTLLLAAAMFALGCGVRFDKVRDMGARPLVLGTLSTVWVLGVACAGVALTR